MNRDDDDLIIETLCETLRQAKWSREYYEKKAMELEKQLVEQEKTIEQLTKKIRELEQA